MKRRVSLSGSRLTGEGGLFNSKAFSWDIRVYYEHTDAGGVVYHASYPRFMERARTEWPRARGYEHDALLRDRGLVFAVRAISVDYRKPDALDDLLRISVGPSPLSHASVGFAHRILRLIGSGHDIELISGNVKIVCLDARTYRPHPLPNDLKKELACAC